MPIRIVKDRDSRTPDDYPGSSESSGGKLPGGINSGCITALLPILLHNPKLLIIIIITGGAFYFLGGQKSCNVLKQSDASNTFTLGGVFDEKMYDKAEVFEPLADNVKNPLPERVSLEKFCPDRLNQGQQGSCVAWASAYGARSILQAELTGDNPNKTAFSPAFLYNQIGLEGCQGSYIIKAMENMKETGAVPFNLFPYNENDCSSQPNQYQLQSAEPFRTKGFNRLSKSGDDYKTDMLAIKQNLAQGGPVVIGMMVGGSFMQAMLGQKVWIPEKSDYQMSGFGGHAMCIIGYDDYLEGGAFQIMNSWGTEWGEKGLAWIRYKDFYLFVKEAYGLYPMGNSEKFDQTKLKVEIGLAMYDDQSGNLRDLPSIPIAYKSGITYATSTPLDRSTRFKIEVTNSIECYIYVFGQETDGSSYVLFPYTAKHSPYCGITGTRLFPRDYSLQPDSIGTRDYMAIVVTKSPVDYKKVNEKISAGTNLSYAARVQNALQEQIIEIVSFSNKGPNIAIECETNGKNAIAIVIEVEKK